MNWELMRHAATKQDLDDTVAIHPTSAEGVSSTFAMLDYNTKPLYRAGYPALDPFYIVSVLPRHIKTASKWMLCSLTHMHVR